MATSLHEVINTLETDEQELLLSIKTIEAFILDQKKDLERLEAKKLSVQRELAKVRHHLTTAKASADKHVYTTQDPVTDHAFCRYMERVQGYDIDKLKASIIKGKEKAIRDLQNGKIVVGDIKLVIKDGIVVTIV
jgi:CHASE3 domain sensor protein